MVLCAKELLPESERAVSATVPHGRGLRHASPAVCKSFVPLFTFTEVYLNMELERQQL
jgi:hypothetical protein